MLPPELVEVSNVIESLYCPKRVPPPWKENVGVCDPPWSGGNQPLEPAMLPGGCNPGIPAMFRKLE